MTTPTFTDVQADDSGLFVIGLREDTTAQARSLIFCESDEDPDEQDVDLGMDTYCLIVEPGQATVYGGVEECDLSDTHLRLRLTGGAAGTLGLPVDSTYGLDLGSEQMDTLRRGLRRVFTSGTAAEHPRLVGF